jgi:hypothetical protein
MKYLIVVATAATVLLGLPGTLFAGDIENLNGQTCGSDAGSWHFVANQVPSGSVVCTLDATWTAGSVSGVLADKVNQKNQHWTIDGIAGELVSAYTSCDGRLVLSDYTCETKEPPCEPDPKTGLCPSEPPKK